MYGVAYFSERILHVQKAYSLTGNVHKNLTCPRIVTTSSWQISQIFQKLEKIIQMKKKLVMWQNTPCNLGLAKFEPHPLYVLLIKAVKSMKVKEAEK